MFVVVAAAWSWYQDGFVDWIKVAGWWLSGLAGLFVLKGLQDEPLLTLPDREVVRDLTSLLHATQTPDVGEVYSILRYAGSKFDDPD